MKVTVIGSHLCPDTLYALNKLVEAKAGCTIFCHCGPGTLGVIFLRKA